MVHFWLRAETKAGEHRVPATPAEAAALIAAGHSVTVERGAALGRAVPDESYAAIAGVVMEEAHAWRTARCPAGAVVFGLKELAAADRQFVRHTHICFEHCFKGQADWREVLAPHTAAFPLYDLEYLVDAQRRRVAAFGRFAGFVGAALGLLAWADNQLAHCARVKQQQQKPQGQGQGQEQPESEPMPTTRNLEPLASREAFVELVRQRLADAARALRELPDDDDDDDGAAGSASSSSSVLPTVTVIGALGRCGSGAVAFVEALGDGVVGELRRWDLAETQGGGPFDALLESHVVVNCIFLSSAIPPFVTREQVDAADVAAAAGTGPARRMSVLCDVSCDTSNPHQPLPVYTQGTTMEEPVSRVLAATATRPPLDVIAIDNLPALLPRESSEEFAKDLLPHLLTYPEGIPWQNALRTFEEKLREAAAAAEKEVASSPSSSSSSSAGAAEQQAEPAKEES